MLSNLLKKKKKGKPCLVCYGDGDQIHGSLTQNNVNVLSQVTRVSMVTSNSFFCHVHLRSHLISSFLN